MKGVRFLCLLILAMAIAMPAAAQTGAALRGKIPTQQGEPLVQAPLLPDALITYLMQRSAEKAFTQQ